MFDLDADRLLIERLGGPTKVARLLGYPDKGGPQRVQNWLVRGIPADVRLQHLSLLMPCSVPDAPIQDHQET